MKKKINIYFMAVSAFGVMITAIISMMLFYNIFTDQVFDDIEAYMHIIQPLNQKFWETEQNQERLEKDGLRITLIQQNGNVQYDSIADEKEMGNHKDRPEIKKALKKGKGTSVRWSNTSSLHTLYYAEQLENGDILRVGKDSENVFQIMKNTAILVMVVSLSILLLCGILSHFLTKRLLSPIEKLASHLDGENMDNVYDEITPFLQTIKEQHITLLDNAKMRQEFTANVSHELKTPLTAISGYAELIGSGMADERDTRRFANEIHSSSNRLLILINDILKLSELDDGGLEFDFEQIDLYQAAQKCLDMMDVQAAKQGISLSLQGESCMVYANPNLLDELLYNLCSNAVRYNNHNGTVIVTVSPEKERVLLSVKDTGIGISEEHQKRVFERFYRVDKSRSKQSGGTGLGLAIVKHIVAQHGAEIVLKSEVEKGTEVKVLF